MRKLLGNIVGGLIVAAMIVATGLSESPTFASPSHKADHGQSTNHVYVWNEPTTGQCVDNGTSTTCPYSQPVPVTIPGPLVIQTDGSILTLDGGPLSFDGKNWTYKGDYHGSGTITFHALPAERN